MLKHSTDFPSNSPNSAWTIRRSAVVGASYYIIYFYAVCVCSPVIAYYNNIMSPLHRNGVFTFLCFIYYHQIQFSLRPLDILLCQAIKDKLILLCTHYYIMYLHKTCKFRIYRCYYGLLKFLKFYNTVQSIYNEGGEKCVGTKNKRTQSSCRLAPVLLSHVFRFNSVFCF